MLYVGGSAYQVQDVVVLPDGLPLTIALEGLGPAPNLVCGVMIEKEFIRHNPYGPGWITGQNGPFSWKIQSEYISDLIEKIREGKPTAEFPYTGYTLFGLKLTEHHGGSSTAEHLRYAMSMLMTNRKRLLQVAHKFSPFLGDVFKEYLRVLEASLELSQ